MQHENSIPAGLCQCGCGHGTKPSPRSDSHTGVRKGIPLSYLPGHQNRKSVRWIVEDRGYETPCWVWQLALNKKGYGRVAVGGRAGGQRAAHTVEWERRNGSVPEGLELDHLCRVPACVNPDHLEPVTHSENLRRSTRKISLEERMIAAKMDRDAAVARFGISPSHHWRLTKQYGDA